MCFLVSLYNFKKEATFVAINVHRKMKKKNKRKNNPKTKTSIFVIIGRVLILLFFLFFLYDSFRQTYINYTLKQNGECVKAIVYDREKGRFSGRNGVVSTRYRFTYENKSYKGYSTSDTKYLNNKSWFYDNFVIGDTIIVVFMKSNPQLNRSNRLIKKKCDCW